MNFVQLCQHTHKLCFNIPLNNFFRVLMRKWDLGDRFSLYDICHLYVGQETIIIRRKKNGPSYVTKVENASVHQVKSGNILRILHCTIYNIQCNKIRKKMQIICEITIHKSKSAKKCNFMGRNLKKVLSFITLFYTQYPAW